MPEISAGNLGSRYRITKLTSLFFLFMLIFLFYGCGGNGSSSSASSDSFLQGTFLDSPVAGLSYEIETHSGTTDQNGTFFYLEGETIRFILGDVYMGQATAAPQMTPIDIVPGATDSTHPAVANMIRFMQTLAKTATRLTKLG